VVNEFYAVTLTSIYHVKDRDSDDDARPVAEKIALKGESRLPVGYKIKGGDTIAIWDVLSSCDGTGRCSHSSSIVALFREELSARACYEAENLKPHDVRWQEETSQMLAEVGPNHPQFAVPPWIFPVNSN